MKYTVPCAGIIQGPHNNSSMKVTEMTEGTVLRRRTYEHISNRSSFLFPTTPRDPCKKKRGDM